MPEIRPRTLNDRQRQLVGASADDLHEIGLGSIDDDPQQSAFCLSSRFRHYGFSYIFAIMFSFVKMSQVEVSYRCAINQGASTAL